MSTLEEEWKSLISCSDCFILLTLKEKNEILFLEFDLIILDLMISLLSSMTTVVTTNSVVLVSLLSWHAPRDTINMSHSAPGKPAWAGMLYIWASIPLALSLHRLLFVVAERFVVLALSKRAVKTNAQQFFSARRTQLFAFRLPVVRPLVYPVLSCCVLFVVGGADSWQLSSFCVLWGDGDGDGGGIGGSSIPPRRCSSVSMQAKGFELNPSLEKGALCHLINE